MRIIVLSTPLCLEDSGTSLALTSLPDASRSTINTGRNLLDQRSEGCILLFMRTAVLYESIGFNWFFNCLCGRITFQKRPKCPYDSLTCCLSWKLRRMMMHKLDQWDNISLLSADAGRSCLVWLLCYSDQPGAHNCPIYLVGYYTRLSFTFAMYLRAPSSGRVICPIFT